MLLPSEDHVALADLPLAILAATGRRAGYNRLAHLAREGRIPADRIGARWYARRSQIAAIAAAL
jgi:hypothetical protein